VKDSPTPTWFNGTEAKHLANTWQTWTLHDPKATPELKRATLDGWFIDILPDLNQDDEECARYIVQNTLWWVGVSGLDGIRQDTLPYVPRRFWREWMAAIKKEYPDLRVVGELFDGDPPRAFYQGGGPIRRNRLRDRHALRLPLYYPAGAFAGQASASCQCSPATPERPELVTPPSTTSPLRRPGATTWDEAAFTFLMTARGIPLVYYGDEIAMPGGGDPDNGGFPGASPGCAASRRGARHGAGRTPPADPATVARSPARGRTRPGGNEVLGHARACSTARRPGR
jgi:glycosidase